VKVKSKKTEKIKFYGNQIEEINQFRFKNKLYE